MLLAIDIGNTNTVIGIFNDSGTGYPNENGLSTGMGAATSLYLPSPESALAKDARVKDLICAFRISTASTRTIDELAIVFTNLLEFIKVGPYSGKAIIENFLIDSIAISSSVPQALSDMLSMLKRLFSVPILVADYTIADGMNIFYQPPEDVGPDRIVDVLAAKDLYGAPAIVVDLGTATTFDVISAQGDYLGGAIIPGLAISQDALSLKAAALRNVQLKSPPKVIGRSTTESVQSGLVFGHVAMIEGMCDKIEEEISAKANLVITGGLAQVIVGGIKREFAYEPWLTLHGLKLAYNKKYASR